MKKHSSYFKVFTTLAMFVGLSFATWSGAGEGPQPSVPAEDQGLAAAAEISEPNTPPEAQDVNATEPAGEPNAPVEIQEPNAVVEGQEPNLPAEKLNTTGPDQSDEPDGPADGGYPIGPPESWDAYRIVVTRNMFSRQRGPRITRRREPRQVPVAPPAPDPESYVVLKGIVQENGEFIAFLEDTQSGQIRRVRQGDSVVRGKIKTLTLDSIEYEFGDRVTTVTMGLNLQGGAGGAAFTGMYELTQTYSSTPQQGTTQTPSPPTADEAEILRQLMERRQQQVGQ